MRHSLNFVTGVMSERFGEYMGGVEQGLFRGILGDLDYSSYNLIIIVVRYIQNIYIYICKQNP